MMIRLLLVIGFAALLLACAGAGAAADDAPLISEEQQESALCQSALRTAEQKYGTPPGLLQAIAKAESGRRIAGATTLQPWPWALNVDGAGLYFKTKNAAVAWTSHALGQGGKYTDVGCMQVDLQFHPSAFRSLEEAYDPELNVDYAARFLLDSFLTTGGNWFVAVGWYHSRSPDLARLYREQITAVGAGLPPVTPSKLRLALLGGGAVVININRQPSRGHRHLTGCQVAAILGPYLRSSVRAC